MKRSGFTMIELIFVIVILGILASVAIPKLAATRDDAKIVAVAQQVQSAVSEIPGYVVAQGKVDGLLKMSQVLTQLNEQGKLTKDGGTGTVSDSDKTVYVMTLDDDAALEPCIKLDVNSTDLTVEHESGSGRVCKGVQERISEGTFTVAGQRIKF